MRLPRRQFLRLATGAAALPLVSGMAIAQVYPSRPVRFIVPLAAGGGLDFVARLTGDYLSRSLGQQSKTRSVRAGSSASKPLPRAPPTATRSWLQRMASSARRTS